jgi:hypothetical protein
MTRVTMSRLAAVAMFATALAIPALAQEPAPAATTASSTEGRGSSDGQPARIVKRSVLPDGSIQLEYSDGTTRRVASPITQSPIESGGAATGLAPSAPPEWLKDAATNQAFLDSAREYYVYKASGLRYRSRVFEWQLFSSRIIFATVILLVASGIVFAAIQFRAGLKRPRAASDATQIDLSAGSIKVSSPVLGVIILVISLAFFYLYLVYVYPISEVV